jgi:AraC family transcriptional regulator, regulatory protein of adaptative response / methylated-DNA-[protein]-cysteine methyltransferase
LASFFTMRNDEIGRLAPPNSLRQRLMAMHATSAVRQDNDECWAAVQERRATADGVFYYSVGTTGIYCRPSCPSRRPRRENVAFHATGQEAERLGFRPCRRCRPNEPTRSSRYEAAVAAACQMIDSAEEPPTLPQIAEAVGMSRFHFHRVFRAVMGITPKAYASARRANRVREALPKRSTVTEAVYDAGFNSSGRFYAAATAELGMRPAAFRTGGAGVRIQFAVGDCSLGSILVAATERGVCAVEFGSDPDALVHGLEQRFPHAQLVGGDPAFERMVADVLSLVERPSVGTQLPLDVRGTAFQRRVWQALRRTTPGSTVSYTDIAQQIGMPSSVRAVARACASNPTAVVIPCHRIVRKDGSLSGYRWGIERKRTLLAREAS